MRTAIQHDKRYIWCIWWRFDSTLHTQAGLYPSQVVLVMYLNYERVLNSDSLNSGNKSDQRSPASNISNFADENDRLLNHS
jgi:hypothetical protein